VKDGAVLIHLETNQIYDLNQTGYRVWQLLQEGLDYPTMLAQIEREFDVHQPQLAKEVDTLIAHLSAEHLLEGDRDGAGPGA
jgi:coenzyme PQQ synthesis protein D (PqqD)